MPTPSRATTLSSADMGTSLATVSVTVSDWRCTKRHGWHARPTARWPRVQMAQVGALPALATVPANRISPAGGMAPITEGEIAPAPEPPKAVGLEVKSPMVGTFYKSPEPGAKAYVAVGDRVTKGQIVCII